MSDVKSVFGLQIGERVVLAYPHVNAGLTGVVVRFETTTETSHRPVVQLDNGRIAFVMDPCHAAKM